MASHQKKKRAFNLTPTVSQCKSAIQTEQQQQKNSNLAKNIQCNSCRPVYTRSCQTTDTSKQHLGELPLVYLNILTCCGQNCFKETHISFSSFWKVLNYSSTKMKMLFTSYTSTQLHRLSPHITHFCSLWNSGIWRYFSQ
jgi:hypothetical protein